MPAKGSVYRGEVAGLARTEPDWTFSRCREGCRFLQKKTRSSLHFRMAVLGGQWWHSLSEGSGAGGGKWNAGAESCMVWGLALWGCTQETSAGRPPWVAVQEVAS